MSDHARKDRLTREALGATGSPHAAAELTPRIVHIGVVVLIAASIAGGLRLDGGIPDAHAVVSAAAQLALSPDAVDGNVQDLTY